MIVTDTLEGSIDDVLWYHYDLVNDVLYIRMAAERDVETVSEETPDGLLLLRRIADDAPVGVTVVNWWKRFGSGARPDSIQALARSIEPWARRIAA